MSKGPWNTKNMVVPGEEELGVQRVCSRCQEPWPLEAEYYWRRGQGWQTWCRACHYENNGHWSWDIWKDKRREQLRLASRAYRARKRIA